MEVKCKGCLDELHRLRAHLLDYEINLTALKEENEALKAQQKILAANAINAMVDYAEGMNAEAALGFLEEQEKERENNED